MSKTFRRSLVLSTVVRLSSYQVFAAVTDSATHAPPAYDTFVPPGTGERS